MRERLVAVVLLALAVAGGLWLSGDSAGAAGANQGNYPVYGWIYPVQSIDGWQKSLPSGKNDQDRYDKDMMIQTHIVYESSGDPARNLLNMQQALHYALDRGWQVVNIQEGKVLIYHPKVKVYDKGRDGDRK